MAMYFVGKDGKQTGPYSVEQLRDMVTRGELAEKDLVWAEGMSEWKPASSLEGLFGPVNDTSTLGLGGSLNNPPPVPSYQPTQGGLTTNPFQPPQTMVGGGNNFPNSGAPKTNSMALTGMILGIFSLTLGMCCCYGLPFSVAGIIFSIMGLSQLKEKPEGQTGRGMALAGLWCSIGSIVVAILLFALGVAMSGGEVMKEFEKAMKEFEKAQKEMKTTPENGDAETSPGDAVEDASPVVPPPPSASDSVGGGDNTPPPAPPAQQ